MTTLADMILVVRQRTDMQQNQFVTDDELAGDCNYALQDLYDTLTGLYEDYRLISATLTATGTTDGVDNNFTLPADCLKARGVDKMISGVWAELDTYEFRQRNDYNCPLVQLPYGYMDVRYRIQDNVCMLMPAGSAPGQYRLWYTPSFTKLTNASPGETDVLPAWMTMQGWDLYAIFDVCAKIAQKQQLLDDAAGYLGRKGEQKERVIAAAMNRNAGPPRRIVNTRDGLGRRGWRGRGGSY